MADTEAQKWKRRYEELVEAMEDHRRGTLRYDLELVWTGVVLAFAAEVVLFLYFYG